MLKQGTSLRCVMLGPLISYSRMPRYGVDPTYAHSPAVPVHAKPYHQRGNKEQVGQWRRKREDMFLFLYRGAGLYLIWGARAVRALLRIMKGKVLKRTVVELLAVSGYAWAVADTCTDSEPQPNASGRRPKDDISNPNVTRCAFCSCERGCCEFGVLGCWG